MRNFAKIFLCAVFWLFSPHVNADLISAGDTTRVDFQDSDWSFGTGDPDLRIIGPRIGFCGTAAGGTGLVSGDPNCDFGVDDSFRLSIFSSSDVLLFSAPDPANGSVSPNTWQNNISLGGSDAFPRSGYLLFELLAGAVNFNEIFLLGVEATPPGSLCRHLLLASWFHQRQVPDLGRDPRLCRSQGLSL